MPRLDAVSPALSVPVHCYYVTIPATVPDPNDVAAALDRIANRWDYFGPLRSLRQVDVYWPSHPEAPAEIAGKGGLYYPDSHKIALNSEADWEACLGHEVGHHVLTTLGEHAASLFGSAFGADPDKRDPICAQFFRLLAAKAGY